MKVSKLAVLGIVVIALVIGGLPVCTAQDAKLVDAGERYGQQGSWELSPFIGMNYFEDKQNLEDSWVYGGRAGYNLSDRFALEAVMETIGTNVDDKTRTSRRPGQYWSPMNDVDLTFYHLDVLYNLSPGKRVAPFLVGAFGGAHYNPSVATKDMTMLGYGAGVKYWLGKNSAIRLDLRDHVVSEVFEHPFHNYSATIGYVFAFGGRSKKDKVVAAPEKEVIVVADVPPLEYEEKVKEAAVTVGTETKVVVLAFEDVHFDFDKSTLNAKAIEILGRTIRILQENPNVEVRIAGYTSASGSNAYNQALSERRAKSVEAYLIREGHISSHRLTAVGYGENSPAEHEVAPRDLYSKAARANMRVQFETIVN